MASGFHTQTTRPGFKPLGVPIGSNASGSQVVGSFCLIEFVSAKTILETETQYHFLNFIFDERKDGLHFIAMVARELGDRDPIDYVCTQRLRKNITEYQWKEGRPVLKRTKILNYLGAEAKDEERSYAVGSFGKEEATFVEFKPEEKDTFKEYFTPRVEYYRRLLFGEDSLIYKVVSSLFFPKAENDERFERRIEAYNNIIMGNKDEYEVREDIDVLLEPLD